MSVLPLMVVGFVGVLFGYVIGYGVGSRAGRVAERTAIARRLNRVAFEFPPGDYRGGLLRAREEVRTEGEVEDDSPEYPL